MARKLAAAVAINCCQKRCRRRDRVEDLLNYFPMRYEDRSNFIRIDQLYDGLEASVEIYTRVSGGFQVGKNRSPKAAAAFHLRDQRRRPRADTKAGRRLVVRFRQTGESRH